MGQIWSAAKRGEGYDLAREHEGFTWGLIIVISTGHFIFRWFAGQPLNGMRKTDAEFWTKGTRKLHNNDRTPGRWSWLPEWKRSAIRQSVLVILIAGVWGYNPFNFWGGGFWDGGPFHLSVHNSFTTSAIALIVLTLWTLIVKTDEKVRNIRHTTGFVNPLKRRFASVFDVHPTTITGNLSRRNIRKGGNTP